MTPRLESLRVDLDTPEAASATGSGLTGPTGFPIARIRALTESAKPKDACDIAWLAIAPLASTEPTAMRCLAGMRDRGRPAHMNHSCVLLRVVGSEHGGLPMRGPGYCPL